MAVNPIIYNCRVGGPTERYVDFLNKNPQEDIITTGKLMTPIPTGTKLPELGDLKL